MHLCQYMEGRLMCQEKLGCTPEQTAYLDAKAQATAPTPAVAAQASGSAPSRCLQVRYCGEVRTSQGGLAAGGVRQSYSALQASEAVPNDNAGSKLFEAEKEVHENTSRSSTILYAAVCALPSWLG
jgi:hypothetical protein